MKINKIAAFTALAMVLVLVPEVAFAADYPGQALLEKIVTIMTGSLARTVGVIMIAGCCYSMYKGRMDWERALLVIFATVGVLGAAQLYDLFAAGAA